MLLFNHLAVCGSFDDQGGKPSGYMNKLFGGTTVALYNGGTWEQLVSLFDTIKDYDIVYWFADVPNDKPKLLSDVKAKNPSCLLVSSKNNLENKYTHQDLIARALKTKSNLLLEITKENNLLLATLHDPLGNVFIKNSSDVNQVRKALFDRAEQLAYFTRVASKSVGNNLPVPKEEDFFSVVKKYADKFHTLIHAVNSDRLLGNASFRCERGFPGIRHDGKIFVSRRNIDKRFIGEDGFVAVEPNLENNTIKYYGELKPSVDTPIQLKLFDYYKSVNYILHSHVYIKDALFTDKVIPCGALEEFEEIKKLVPAVDSSDFCINLLGHGSLILANSVSYVESIESKYYARPTPELQLEK